MADIKERNYCLDYIKGLACIFVVFMHCEFPGYLGVFVQCISRFCVPFFFMVSGYFCFGGRTDYKKKIRHVGTIILGATIFYLLVTPLYTSGFSITLQDLVKLLVFNVPPYIAGQLWFLFALLYDYMLFALTEKLGLRRLAYLSIPVGIVVYILLAQGAHILGFSIPNLIYRNFLIEGFPLFSLGFRIHEHQDEIRISNRALLLTVVISTLLCPVERMLMGRDFGVNIVTFPQVTALFLLGVKNPGFGAGKLLNRLGSKHSMYVYIIHPAVMHLLRKTYKATDLASNAFASYMLPILCVVLTVLCSVVFLWLKEQIRTKLLPRSGA